MVLEANKRRAVWRATHFKAWGADVVGKGGWAGPPRRKRIALAALTADVLAGGVAHEALMESLFGSGAFFLQFRRHLFSIMQSLYTEVAGNGGGRFSPFRFKRGARGELTLLSILGLASRYDLRTGYHPLIYCTDASPFGEGVCGAKAGLRLARDLWRCAGRRGRRTALLTPLVAALREARGGESADCSDEEEGPSCQPLEEDRLREFLKVRDEHDEQPWASWAAPELDRFPCYHDALKLFGRLKRVVDLREALPFLWVLLLIRRRPV